MLEVPRQLGSILGLFSHNQDLCKTNENIIQYTFFPGQSLSSNFDVVFNLRNIYLISNLLTTDNEEMCTIHLTDADLSFILQSQKINFIVKQIQTPPFKISRFDLSLSYFNFHDKLSLDVNFLSCKLISHISWKIAKT